MSLSTTAHHGQGNIYVIRLAQSSDLPHLASVERSASSAFITQSDPDLAPLADDEPMSIATVHEHAETWKSYPDVYHDDGTVVGIWVAIAESTASSDSNTNGEVVGFIVTSLLSVSHEVAETGTSEQIHSQEGGQSFIHIHELSVHVNHQRRGLAKRLVNAVKEFAAERNTPKFMQRKVDKAEEETGRKVDILGLSLTTFRDVPFNAPFYRRLGFEVVEAEMIPGLVGQEGEIIWQEERERFLEIGDGKLADRRCWMICHCEY